MSQTNKTKLYRQFTFWFLHNNKQMQDWQAEMKKVCQFDTVEDFWGYYQHFVRPEELPPNCEFFLFQDNIKPMWEDKNNENGGRYKLRIKKQYGNRFWEDLILSFIGEQCEDNNYICGLVVLVKEKEVVFSIWVKEMPNEQIKDNVRQWIRKSLGLNERIEVEYRDHPKAKPTENNIQQ